MDAELLRGLIQELCAIPEVVVNPDYDALRRRADAALSVAQGQGWRPIESAPEGYYVLLGNPKWASPGCGAKEDGEWLDFGFAYDPPPTHWMPLPAAPAQPDGVE